MHARVSSCRFKTASLVAICTCILRLDAYSQALAHTNEPYRSEIWVGSSKAKLPEIKSDLEKIGGQMDERYKLRVQQDADFEHSAEGKALKVDIDQTYSTKD